MLKKTITINGLPKTLIVDPDAFLGDVLCKQLYLTGKKVYCGDGSPPRPCRLVVDAHAMIVLLWLG